METFSEHEFPDEKDYEGDLGKAPPIYPNINPAEVGIIKELSPLKVLKRIRENLRGRFWDEDEKEYKKIEGFEPLMNDYGINKFLTILGSVLNDVVTMSNIPPDEVNRLVLHVCDNTIPVMYIDYKKWGIKSKGDLELLSNQIFMVSYGALHKASGAGDRSVIRGTISENIMQRTSNVPMPEQGKKGFMSKLNPFARL